MSCANIVNMQTSHTHSRTQAHTDMHAHTCAHIHTCARAHAHAIDAYYHNYTLIFIHLVFVTVQQVTNVLSLIACFSADGWSPHTHTHTHTLHLLSFMHSNTNEVKQHLNEALISCSSHPDCRTKCIEQWQV